VLFQEITSAQRKLSMSRIINSTYSESYQKETLVRIKYLARAWAVRCVIFLDIDLEFFVLSMDALGIILHFFYLWSQVISV
jgi:hypothetical protein